MSIRLEIFALNNRLLDPSLQKGFLHGVNGTMKHIFSTDSLLDNARATKKTIVISFLDLQNAFGSVLPIYLMFYSSYLLPTLQVAIQNYQLMSLSNHGKSLYFLFIKEFFRGHCSILVRMCL